MSSNNLHSTSASFKGALLSAPNSELPSPPAKSKQNTIPFRIYVRLYNCSNSVRSSDKVVYHPHYVRDAYMFWPALSKDFVAFLHQFVKESSRDGLWIGQKILSTALASGGTFYVTVTHDSRFPLRPKDSRKLLNAEVFSQVVDATLVDPHRHRTVIIYEMEKPTNSPNLLHSVSSFPPG